MSSIDPQTAKKLDALAVKIYKLDAAMDASGMDFRAEHAPVGFSCVADSYFLCREKRSMDKADFVVPGISADGDLALALKERWVDKTKLAALAEEVAKLVELFRKEEKEQSDEVSSFIYMMF